MGWSLAGLPSIVRCPTVKAQYGVWGAVNNNAGDSFCLEGQLLVAVSGVYGADGSEYRTEIESYSRIILHGTTNGSMLAWFEVHTKNWFLGRLTTATVTSTTP